MPPKNTRSVVAAVDKKSTTDEEDNNSSQQDKPGNSEMNVNNKNDFDSKLDSIINDLKVLKVIKSDVEAIRAEQSDIIKSIDHCFAMCEENKSSIQNQETLLNSCVNNIDVTSNEVDTLKRQL
ncbi:hypothetical protein LSTR_LSTR003489, partial [Laodelphax striatellus]